MSEICVAESELNEKKIQREGNEIFNIFFNIIRFFQAHITYFSFWSACEIFTSPEAWIQKLLFDFIY